MIRPGVEFIAPFRIYLTEKFFTVNIESGNSLVKPIAIPPISTEEGVQVHGRQIEISHDIFGFAGRTKFAVMLDYEIDVKLANWKQAFSDKEAVFIDLALFSVNRMLEVYRDQDRNNLNEKSFHVIPLVRTDLSDIRLVAVDDSFTVYCFRQVKRKKVLV
jgi:hypothetical protein